MKNSIHLRWGLLACLSIVWIFQGSARAQSGGAVLYNGIVLPQQWPPVQTLNQNYVVPSYITNPPALIQIDVGRQLFVDDFLIQQTSMTRTQHQPVMYPGNPVLSPSESDTTGNAFPYSDGVWFDPSDSLFKMWYYCAGGDTLCYAYSLDGKIWTRPSIADAVVPNTNQVLQIPGGRDSATVWLDLNETNPAHRFKAFFYEFTSTFGIRVYFSADGIHWFSQNQPTYPVRAILDRTTLFWNPFRNLWVDSLKNYLTIPASGTRPAYISRVRYYAESPDLMHWTVVDSNNSFWTGPDVNDPTYVAGGMYPQLYNLDGVGYESVIVGLFSWYYPGPAYQSDDPNGLPGPALVELGVGFSRDGFQWVRPTRGSGPSAAFIPASNVPGAWDMGDTQSSGGGFLVVGDQLWFYFSARNGPHGKSTVGATGLATLRRDGFYSMDAGSTAAQLTTRPIQFTGKYMFVNVSDPQGSLQIQVLNPANNQVLATSLPITGDRTLQQVSWANGLADLSAFAGQPIEFQFSLTNGELYSFWVTASASGASNGYAAANGPGFTGNKDTLGAGSYVLVAPASVTLSSGQTQQFTANMLSATDQTVNWSISPNVGTISTSGMYTAPVTLAGTQTVTVIATSVANPTEFGSAAVNLNSVIATFIGTDTTAQGNWQTNYGADGYSVPNVSQSIPPYASFSPQNEQSYTWSPNTADLRVLRNASGGAAMATTWFSNPNFDLDVNFTDGASHRVAVYALDWDNRGRSETIQILSAQTNAILDTRTISNFAGGVYLIWNLSGHVKINVTLVSGPNVVLSGAFFGGAAQAGTISVGVSPQLITLNAAQTQQFAATVSGASNQNVAWSLSPQIGNLSPTGFYTAPSTIATSQTVAITATSSADASKFGTAAVNLVATGGGGSGGGGSAAVANFVASDASTQGNWQGVYGAEGYSVANSTQSIPSYAAFAIQNQANFTWSPSPSDTRALELGSGTARIASTWFNYPTFSFDINFTDGNLHQLATYALDWDNTGRAETIQITDSATKAILDSRNISTFGSGIYLLWNISGHVTITVTATSGPNAVISGVFFGGNSAVAISPQSVNLAASQTQQFTATVTGNPNHNVTWSLSPQVGSLTSGGFYTAPAVISPQTVSVTATSVADPAKFATAKINLTIAGIASFVGADSGTQGNWNGVYGAEGYAIANEPQSLPSYASVSLQGQQNYTWNAATTDLRALQTGGGSGRMATTWFSTPTFNFVINFSDANSHQVALYAVDWDGKGRAETIQIRDALSNALLDTRTVSNFAGGIYLIWSLSGNVQITVTMSNGPNAVMSGVFFK